MDRVETVQRILSEWARGNWRAGGELRDGAFEQAGITP